jgi:hypothetical protein
VGGMDDGLLLAQLADELQDVADLLPYLPALPIIHLPSPLLH